MKVISSLLILLSVLFVFASTEAVDYSVDSSEITSNGWLFQADTDPESYNNKQSDSFVLPIGLTSAKFNVEIAGLTKGSFTPELKAGDIYKFEITNRRNNEEGTFTWTVSKTSGEQVSVLFTASEDGLVDSSNLIQDRETNVGTEHKVTCTWAQPCDIGYDNLHSDFNVVLDESSTLAINNAGSPELQINFWLPTYYYGVKASYQACADNSDFALTYQHGQNAPGRTSKCDTKYSTTVSYTDYCQFTLEEREGEYEKDSNEVSQVLSHYSYSGELYIEAKLQLVVAGFNVERSVSAPLNWVVYLDRTISIQTDIELDNADTCNEGDYSGCSNHGCCEENPEAPNTYWCNCECVDENVLSGYDGDNCENDATAPTCSIDADGDGYETVSLDSTHGGCVKHTFDSVTFDDNSGVYWVAAKVIDADGSESFIAEASHDTYSLAALNDICWDIGTHRIELHAADIQHGQGPGPNGEHTANDHVFCGWDIVVSDKADPFVDCLQCNADGTAAKLCVNNGGIITQVNSGASIAQAQLKTYFDQTYQETNGVVSFAGATYGCNCEENPEDKISGWYTGFGEGQNGWGLINAIDVTDSSVTTSSATDPSTGGDFPIQDITYSATDDATNEGTCTINVGVDRTPPSCTGFTDTAEPKKIVNPIHENDEWGLDGDATENLIYANETDPYPWFAGTSDDILAIYDISGEDVTYNNGDGPLLSQVSQDGVALNIDLNPSGHIFYVDPSKATSIYTATYTIKDNAGNTATCNWQLTVTNPEPCTWPTCQDQPPLCDVGVRPGDAEGIVPLDCDDENLSDCGCGSWGSLEGLFKDDRGIIETTRTRSHESGDKLELGDTNVKYTACDYHGSIGANPSGAADSGANDDNSVDDGHCAVCRWTIRYTDTTAPTFDQDTMTEHCPDGVQAPCSLCDQAFILAVDESGNSATFTYTISGRDSCVLNTGMELSGGQTGASSQTINNQLDDKNFVSYSGSDVISATYGDNSRSYKWVLEDGSADSDAAVCEWTVEVRDNDPPTIDCTGSNTATPYTWYARVPQGQSTTSVPFYGIGSDANTADEDLVYTWTIAGNTGVIDNTYQFPPGTYTLTGTVYDEALNSNQCTIGILVNEAYPLVYLRPTLTKANVYANDNNQDIWDADLQLTILTNSYHVVESVKWASGEEDNSQITSTSPLARLNGESCALVDAICANTYDFKAQWNNCEENDRVYRFTAQGECQGVGHGLTGQHIEDVCSETIAATTFDATVKAANYCWQSLAGVDTDADFIITDEALFTAWRTDQALAVPTGVAKPTHATSVFSNLAQISGIVTLKSDTIAQNNFDGLRFTALTKTHHLDSSYTTANAPQYNMLGAGWNDGDFKVFDSTSATGGSDWAGFTYQEKNVPIEETNFVRYSATVSIDNLDFSKAGRRLLSIETQRGLQQNDDSLLEQAVAKAFMTSNPLPVVAAATNPDDAIVVMMLQNCDESNTEWEDSLSYAIAKYLRIDSNRVTVQVDPTTEGYCLVEATISQADCADNVDIISLLEFLENGLSDTFSELHTYVAQDLPVDATLDNTVFFVAQQPSEVYQTAAVGTSTSSTIDTSSDFAWYYYIGAGVAVGLTTVLLLGFVCSKRSKATNVTTDDGERRYSIADLLAQQNTRRSSVDINNVRLHNAL